MFEPFDWPRSRQDLLAAISNEREIASDEMRDALRLRSSNKETPHRSPSRQNSISSLSAARKIKTCASPFSTIFVDGDSSPLRTYAPINSRRCLVVRGYRTNHHGVFSRKLNARTAAQSLRRLHDSIRWRELTCSYGAFPFAIGHRNKGHFVGSPLPALEHESALGAINHNLRIEDARMFPVTCAALPSATSRTIQKFL